MNHTRDGQGRHRITKGSINYWPNRFNIVPPSKPAESYVDYPEKVVAMKQRLHSKKFGVCNLASQVPCTLTNRLSGTH